VPLVGIEHFTAANIHV